MPGLDQTQVPKNPIRLAEGKLGKVLYEEACLVSGLTWPLIQETHFFSSDQDGLKLPTQASF